MSNPINNNFNFNILANRPAGLVGQTGQNAQIGQIGQDGQGANPQAQNSQTNAQNFQFQQINIPTLNFESVLMEKDTVLKYLQSLMKLPNSIDKFIKELAENKNNPKFLEILTQNLINVKALNELLNQNSTQAIQKLLQTLSELSKSGMKDTEQLRDILALLGAIQTNTNNNSNSIKELLLLYIPLNIQEYDKSVSLSGFNEFGIELSKQDLSLMIETVNFSNILAILNCKNEQIFVDLYCAESFPFGKYEKIVSQVSKKLNISPSFDFKILKSKEIKNEKQNFIAQSNGTIQTNVLILAHILIRIIFKMDNDFAIKNESD